MVGLDNNRPVLVGGVECMSDANTVREICVRTDLAMAYAEDVVTVNSTITDDTWVYPGWANANRLSKAKSSISAIRVPTDHMGACSNIAG